MTTLIQLIFGLVLAPDFTPTILGWQLWRPFNESTSLS